MKIYNKNSPQKLTNNIDNGLMINDLQTYFVKFAKN